MKYGLHQLETGQRCRIAALEGGDSMVRRLADMGFTPGAAVECLYKSPAGDPAAYLIRDTVIALRRADAARVEVRL